MLSLPLLLVPSPEPNDNGPNAKVKSAYNACKEEWLEKHSQVVQFEPAFFNSVVAAAWRKAASSMQHAITEAFRITGIFPLNHQAENFSGGSMIGKSFDSRAPVEESNFKRPRVVGLARAASFVLLLLLLLLVAEPLPIFRKISYSPHPPTPTPPLVRPRSPSSADKFEIQEDRQRDRNSRLCS